MPVPSLADLPGEILENILSFLGPKYGFVYASDKFFSFLYCLLSNKRTISEAARHLYRDPVRFCSIRDNRFTKLFATLDASAKGQTTIPYHLFVEKLSVRDLEKEIEGRRRLTSSSIDYVFAWRKLVLKLLQNWRLRDLELSFPKHFVLEEGAVYDVSRLKSLRVFYDGYTPAGMETMAWMETLPSKMRLESLTIEISPDTFSQFPFVGCTETRF